MKSNTLFQVLFSLTPVLALQAANIEYLWRPAPGSTDASVAANWDPNAVPGNGDVKTVNWTFGQNGYTGIPVLRIPAASVEAPYRDAAGMSVYGGGMPDGTTVVIDATGTSWLQQAEPGTTWKDSKVLRFSPADHIWNIEGLNAVNAQDNFGFTLTDGKFTYTHDNANGSRVVYEGGTFNMATTPEGLSSPHQLTLLHDADQRSSGSVVEFRSGTTYLDYVNVRGNTPGGKVLFSGGDHHIIDGLVINTSKNTDNDAVVQVSGGKVTLDNSSLWIGKEKLRGTGVLRIDGDGVFEMSPNTTTVYFPDHAEAKGRLEIAGHGKWLGRKSICMGHNGGTADIIISEHGEMDENGFNMTENGDCHTSLTVKDDGRIVSSYASIARDGGNRHATLDFQDRADVSLKLAGGMANAANAFLTMRTSGTPTIGMSDASANLNFGVGVVDLDLAGGTFTTHDGAKLTTVKFSGGYGSVHKLSGAVVAAQNVVIDALTDNAHPEYFSTLELTGGQLTVTGGNGLDIRGGAGGHAMVLMTGGYLKVGNMFRIGHSRNSSGARTWRSVFRQTGGLSELQTVNLCDSATAGEVELLGGRARIYELRGWNNCATRGGTAWAKCFFNGGTIEPMSDNRNFFYTMDEVRLGAAGLTVDTLAYQNVIMRVKLEDAEGADGLFVKTGTGRLKASLVETDSGAKNEWQGRSLAGTHAVTRVDQGTLLFVDTASVGFGRAVVVKGGATLSLEGTPTTLTVESLTLGDGHGFAVLKLDAGDTVTVTAANGLRATCGALDVPWTTTNGTYPVFVCHGEVATSELAKISVLNGSATKDYGWTTATDEDGNTVCSLVVADVGTLTSSIAYDSAAGDGTQTGTGPVAQITASASATESGDVTLAHNVRISVEADKTLALDGALVGTGVDITKTGSGKLTLGGNNTDLFGALTSDGGTLEATSLAALGGDGLYFPLTLGGGTFHYTGTEEAVFNGTLRIDAGAHKKAAILKNDGDMTFKSTEYVQGLFTKLGTGTLTLDLPAGTFAIGSGSNDENVGENGNGGQFDFPASGDAPTSISGFYGVNVLEGTLKVKGAGIAETKLSTANTAVLGGGYLAQVAPILEVEDATVNWGAGSRHGHIGRDLPSGAPMPEVRLTNAKFWSDSPTLGRFSTDGRGVVKLTMKDSEYYGHYNSQIGSETVAVIIDADNSSMHSNGDLGWTIQARTLTADFHGADAELASFNDTVEGTGSAGGRFWFYDKVTGMLQFRDGARLRTSRGVLMNKATLSVSFDGGIFEIIKHKKVLDFDSTWNAAGGAGFETKGNGLEIAIAAEMTHGFNFPIYGTGSLKKTGAGTFKLVEGRMADEKLLQNTGLTEVAEGTLMLDGACVAETANLKVDAGAALVRVGESPLRVASFAAEEGATVASCGAVTTDELRLTVGECPVFTETTFVPARDGVILDFGEEEPVVSSKMLIPPVAKFVDSDGHPLPASQVTVANWSGLAKGYSAAELGKRGGSYIFSYEESTGLVYAQSRAKSGFSVVIR